MSTINPSSRTWTVRFKHHRTTILLHIDPIQRIPIIKAELLKALQHTSPGGTFNGHDIPKNSGNIVLAKPMDIHDLTVGWQSIERDEEAHLDDEIFSSKGKGKASAVSKGRTSGKGSSSDTLQGLGLRDGGVVAFKFRTDADEGEQGSGGGRNEGDEDDVLLDGRLEEEQWDVVVPSLEETYGDAASQDA